MRITSLTLYDYIPFTNSAIKKLTVNFNQNVELIIGANGSGKSACTEQLSTTPPVRSLFNKKGFKSLTIEKDGVSYRLDSEFEKPSSPHAFFEGDTEDNLNVGRTTDTQKELIEHYLGITSLVDDLIMNRYKFPDWTPAKRKQFLMEANPDQIGFVLGLIKQTTSKIKACRNNLARLQSRKILLEQDMLEEDSLNAIVEEKSKLNKDLEQFQQSLLDIQIGLGTLPKTNSTVSLGDLTVARKTVQRYRQQLSGLSHVARDDDQRQHDREKLMTRLAVTKDKMEETDHQILEQVTALSELEVRYRELASEGEWQGVDQTIARLEAEQERLEIPAPSFELSAEDLQRCYNELDELQHRLLVFNTRSVTLLSTKKRQHREKLLSSCQYKQTSYRLRMSDLHNQLEAANKRHTVKPRDIPDAPCAKGACPLYSHFMEEYSHGETQRAALTASLAKGEHYIRRLNQLTHGLHAYFDNAQPYHDEIQWLIGYAQSNPVLYHQLRSMDILSVLSTNPNRISRQLHDEYDRISQWLKLKSIKSDLTTAYALRSRQISSESHDTISLVSSLENAKQTLGKLRSAIKSLLAESKQVQRELDEVNRFSDIKKAVFKFQEIYLQVGQQLAHGHEQDKLMFLKQGLDRLRAQHFLRLSEIERILQVQSGLKERYQEEVLGQITAIEKELSDLQQIEQALIILPQENMISFINRLFTQANRLIASVWTIPFELELLPPDDPLTYEFKVSGDNQSTNEISKCSEGQAEILSLALNLSLRIVLGHTNYPLCLDETGRTFDSTHRNNLVTLLKTLLDTKVVSQLFYVSHHATVHDNFPHVETLVLREDNILLPAEYNTHAVME